MLDVQPHFLPDEASTIALGKQLAETVQAGDVLALIGDLGSGKTTLTQGVMLNLGFEKEVTSPTFSLVQEYHGGRLPVFHFDFYRVKAPEELLDLGWDDYLERGGLTIVEWPALFPELLPQYTLWLKLSHYEDGRWIEPIDGPT